MKRESQKQDGHVFFLTTENILLHVIQPYTIQHKMIETRNFMPESFLIHHFRENNCSGIDCYNYLRLSKGEMRMPALDVKTNDYSEASRAEPLFSSPNLRLHDEDEDQDWDEDDEDWDEDDEDEDWDEDEEDWEDDDEDWDYDEDEDWEDEDEEE